MPSNNIAAKHGRRRFVKGNSTNRQSPDITKPDDLVARILKQRSEKEL